MTVSKAELNSLLEQTRILHSQRPCRCRSFECSCEQVYTSPEVALEIPVKSETRGPLKAASRLIKHTVFWLIID